MLNGIIEISDLTNVIKIGHIDFSETIMYQLSDAINRYAKCNMERHRNEKLISSHPLIQEILFFNAEYRKRKFYLDCTVEKEEGIYTIDKKRYVFAECKHYSDSERIVRTNFLTEDDCVLSLDNRMGYEEYNYNVYNFLKSKHKCVLKLIKDIIHFPARYGLDLLENEQNIFNKFIRDANNDKYYELLLYYLGDEFINNAEYPIKSILNIIKYPFWECTNSRVLKLLKNIVDKYGLYLSDMFQPTSVESIVKNKTYTLPPPSYMFSGNGFENNIIDISQNTPPKAIIIFLINDRVKNSCTFANLDNEYILSSVYKYENHIHTNLAISDYIDCNGNNKILTVMYNLENQTDIEERCIGLYIWDKIYLNNTKRSVSQVVEHLCYTYKELQEKIKDMSDAEKKRFMKSMKRIRGRYFNGTVQCIEKMALLPLTGKDIADNKMIKDKHLESIRNKNEIGRGLIEASCQKQSDSPHKDNDFLELLFKWR